MAQVTILVGTTKGAFLVASDADRSQWEVSGPHCDGWPINHVVGDPSTGMIWAGGGSGFSGAGVWASADQGATWSRARLSRGQIDEWAAHDPEFAAFLKWTPEETPFDGVVETVWSLHRGAGALWAGGKPGCLFRSGDDGQTWEAVSGFNAHETRESWMAGAAGLVVHSLVSDPADPKKIWAGVSSAGVFASEDGGATWERRNRLDNAEGCAHHHHPAAPRDGLTGLCVHNMVRAPGEGDTMYQQNHHGVFRSRDGERNWQDMTAGLPSHFGFPIAVHPRDPEMLWVLPLNGDTEGRYPPEAAAAVWRSVDGGESWQAQRTGLPQKSCFFTVLRQAMAVDNQPSVGVYFGTNTGSVFMSRDEGETWDEVVRHLPCVLSVEVLEGE